MVTWHCIVKAWTLYTFALAIVVLVALPRVKAAASLRHRRLEATERMPLCTLGKALTTGKAKNEFNLLDKNEMSGYLPVRASRWRGSLIHGEQLAWITAQCQKTVLSNAVIVKVFAVNYKKFNEFLHQLIKLAMCTGRKNSRRSLTRYMTKGMVVIIYQECNH